MAASYASTEAYGADPNLEPGLRRGVLVSRQRALAMQGAADAAAQDRCARGNCSGGHNGTSSTGTRSPIQPQAVTPRQAQLRAQQGGINQDTSPRTIADLRGDCSRYVPPASAQQKRGVTGRPQQIIPPQNFQAGQPNPYRPNPLGTPRGQPTIASGAQPCNCTGGTDSDIDAREQARGASDALMGRPFDDRGDYTGGYETGFERGDAALGSRPTAQQRFYGAPRSNLRLRSNLRSRRIQLRGGF